MNEPPEVTSEAGPEQSLSSAGQRRRDAMLDELVSTMHRTHRIRRVRRATLASAGMILLIISLSMIALPDRSPSSGERSFASQPQANDATQGNVPSQSPESRLASFIVRTDPTILDRVTITPASHVAYLDDDELLRELAAINRPAGMIRTAAGVRLTVDVTDPIEPAAPLPPESSSL